MSMVKCPSCGMPVQVPAQKSGMWWGVGCLIALGVGVVMIAVMGLLAAIAIPSFVKARQTSQTAACINNMRMIDAAKEQTAMAQQYEDGAEVTAQEISMYLKYGYSGVACPLGGTYTINPVGTDPACSTHGTLTVATARRNTGR